MFRIFKNLKSIDLVPLRNQDKLSYSASRSYAFLSTKRISLPEISDDKLRASVLAYVTTKNTDNENKNYKFYCFYGDRAYSYYTTRALNLKFPDATRKEKIANTLSSRNFLKEVAKACGLDKMISGSKGNLGEMMEAYISGMLFNGMEEEIKKFTSDVIDYYVAEEGNGTLNVENVNIKAINVKQEKAEEKVKVNEINKVNEKGKRSEKAVGSEKKVNAKFAKISKKLKKRNLLLLEN